MNHRCISVIAALAALVALVLPDAGSGPAVARADGVAAWSAAPGRWAFGPAGRGPILSTLPAVSAASPNNAWAAGYQAQTLAGPTNTVILHWNGKSWTRVKSPDPGRSDNVLTGVSAVSPDAAWAVGGYEVGTSPRFKTLISRWNGKRWSMVRSPGPGTGIAILLGVSAISPTSAWAAGYYQSRPSRPFRTLILRWNGKAWSMVKSPDPSHGSNALYAVQALSARSAWAVGNYCVARCNGSLGLFSTLVLRWNGRTWSKIKSPGAGQANNLLDGVAAISGGDAWATGYSCEGKSTCLKFTRARRLLILHWNGRAWSKAPAQNPGELSELGEVAATSPANAWAVGDYCLTVSEWPNFDRLKTLIMHWNGRRWSRVSSPNPGAANSLGAITALSSVSAWATGYYCATASCSVEHPLIARWNGKSWSRVAAPSPPARER